MLEDPTQVALEQPDWVREAFEDSPWGTRIVGHGFLDPEQAVAHPENWRIHPVAQHEAVEGSLDTFGWVEETLVNKNTGFVLNGHERFGRALYRQQNDPEGRKYPVPVCWVDLSEDEERAVLAVLDNITTMATPDRTKLMALLEQARNLRTDSRLSAMMEDLRDRFGSPTVLPPQESDAYFLENQYPIPEDAKPRVLEDGTVVEPDDGGETVMKVMQLYLTKQQWAEYQPKLRVVGQHSNVVNVTDTVLAAIDIAVTYITELAEDDQDDDG
jgi:hypothetical protein